MGIRRCSICRTKADRERRIVLHSFERRNHLEKWLKACGLNDTVDVTKLLICTNHFTIDDYSARHVGGRLIDSAVPSVDVPYPPENYVANSEQESRVEDVQHTDTVTINENSTFETGTESDHLNFNTPQGVHTVWVNNTDNFTLAEDNSSNSILPSFEQTSGDNVDSHFDEITEEVWIKESPVSSPAESVVEENLQYDPLVVTLPSHSKISKVNVEPPLGLEFWQKCADRWKELAEKKVKDVKRLEEENRRLLSKVDEMQSTIDSLERKLAGSRTENFVDQLAIQAQTLNERELYMTEGMETQAYCYLDQ